MKIEQNDMATMNIIAEALKAVNEHDFCWMMADYGANQLSAEARGHMKYFVSLLHQIENTTVVDALRTLWIATAKLCQNFSATDDDRYEYVMTKNAMLDIINPAIAQVA